MPRNIFDLYFFLCSQQMLVIVTGEFDRSDPAELNERINILRSRGVDVIVIGVGNVDIKVIQSMTSNKPGKDDQVLLAKYFNGILQYTQDIADFACGEGVYFLITYINSKSTFSSELK